MGKLTTAMFEAGFVKDRSQVQARPQWTDGDKVRFIGKNPANIGGWEKLIAEQFNGKCRGLLSWQDFSEVKRLAIGTHTKLYQMSQGSLVNITPYSSTGTLTDPFTTTNGSATVTVTHNSHQRVPDDTVNFANATAVGGLTIDGDYTVVSTSPNSYTITAAGTASSSATGGGSVDYQYELGIGFGDATPAFGYGVGGYGVGTYGTPRSTSVLLAPRTWTLDKFDEYLLACPRGGNLYDWQLNVGSRAELVAAAPTQNLGVFVTEDRHAVLFGADGNKLKVKWCDQGDYGNWTVSDVTSAGTRTLTGGSEIYCGIPTVAANLLLTDLSVWTMTLIGGDDVFSFKKVGEKSGAIGPGAAGSFEGVVFWMGQGEFYRYDGVIRPLRNSDDIRRFVFDDLNADQKAKIVCGVNSAFREIWWKYPSAGSDENDRYVVHMLDSGRWVCGTIARTAWVDKSTFAYPIAAGADGYLYQHEYGEDADGSPMEAYITSSPILLSDGQALMEVVAVYPDFHTLTGSVTLTFLVREYPQSTDEEVVASAITSSTTKIDPRVSGRLTRIKIDANELGAKWRLGAVMMEIQPNGER